MGFNDLLLYTASALTAIWGTAHLFPTRSIVKGFGNITADSKRILMMEWIVEGVALVLIAILVAVVTAIDASSSVSKAVYGISAAGLLTFAFVSLLTGFRVAFLPFKLCPIIFSISAILILVGGLAL